MKLSRFTNITFFTVFLLITCGGFLYADKHPMAKEIQAYLDAHPIDPRIPELLDGISPQSMEMNKTGYQTLMEKQYNHAADSFLDAIDIDEGNVFAWYNLGCTYGLIHAAQGVSTGNAALSAASAVARAAELEWYWGLKLMVDTDLDSVRHFELAEKKQLQPGPMDTGIIHTIHEDGTVIFTVWYEDLSGMGNDTSEDIASGWYCRIGDRVFEFFPSIPAYVIEPERENAVFIYPAEAFE